MIDRARSRLPMNHEDALDFTMLIYSICTQVGSFYLSMAFESDHPGKSIQFPEPFADSELHVSHISFKRKFF